jgi:mannose-6-phosphate isomerase-like protein (cupin superfamily)
MTERSPLDPLQISREVLQAYHNRRVTSVNDHEIRMSVMTHGFPWHHHPHSDETFYCIEGELVIEFADGEVALQPGQMLTVPKGVRHRTRPGGDRSVNLTFEKREAETVFDRSSEGALHGQREERTHEVVMPLDKGDRCAVAEAGIDRPIEQVPALGDVIDREAHG